MDFISTLYETFSGQTLGRPDKKHKRKLRAQRGVSVAKSPILMSLKSPQKGKVAKKKSARPNLKSITNTSNNNNKPVPPNKKSSGKRTSAIQFAIESGEKSTLPSLMRKIETKKRAILVQIEALEKEVRTKKAEVVELEKELLLGASSW